MRTDQFEGIEVVSNRALNATIDGDSKPVNAYQVLISPGSMCYGYNKTFKMKLLTRRKDIYSDKGIKCSRL